MVPNILLNKGLCLKFLSNFYLFLLFFYLFSLSFFSTHLVFFSKSLSRLVSFGGHAVFVIFLFFLFLFFRTGKKAGFWLALFFHNFFLANFISMLFWNIPLFSLESPYPSKTFIPATFFLWPAIIINIGIIFYLLFHFYSTKGKI